MGRLFSTKLLTKYCQAFGFPPDLQLRSQKILNWCILFQHNPSTASDRAEFVHDLFVELLGYKSPFIEETEWELEFEPEIGLGFFGLNSDNGSGMEAKILWHDWNSCLLMGSGDQSTNQLSSDQLNSEKSNLEKVSSSKWIIVLSDRSISLYVGSHNNQNNSNSDVSQNRFQPDLLAYERFEFENLADLEQLKAFYFLFGRRTLLKGSVKSNAASRLELILAESEELELENCQEFYSQYQRIRLQLIKDFRYRLQSTESLGENKAQELAIAQAQKLLNRIIFITYGEGCNLFPSGMLRQAYQFHNPYRAQPAWENYRAIFGWLREGKVDLQPPILAFKLDLFDFDPLLDNSLFVGEELCRQIKELTKFNLANDFSDRAIADILNEIVRDLKSLRQDQMPKEKRKRFKLTTKNQSDRYQAQILLQKQLQQLKQSEIDIESLEYWQEYETKLNQLKIIDRKCQNGIAIADAFNILLVEYQTIYQAINHLTNNQITNNSDVQSISQSSSQPKSDLVSQPSFEAINLKNTVNLIAQISSQLYACDLDCEAIEVTKLHLYLRILSLCNCAFSSDFNCQLANSNDCFSESSNDSYFEI